MPDLILKALTLKNWMMYQDTRLEFPPSGLILVSGTVGAGKTAIGEALCRTLFGMRGRFTYLANCVNDFHPAPLYVGVEAELHGKPLLVELGFKHPPLSRTGEGLRFTYAGKATEQGHITDTRAELNKALHVSPTLAPWTIFIDADKIWLSRVPEHERVSLLMETMAQPWADYFERSKLMLSNFKQAAKDAEAAHGHALETQREAEDQRQQAQRTLEEAQVDHAQVLEAWEQVRATARENLKQAEAALKAKQDEQAKVRKQLKELEEKHATAYQKLELQQRAAEVKLQEAREVRTDAIAGRATANSTHEQAEKNVQEVTGPAKNCPTCNQPWKQEASADEISRRWQQLETALAEQKQAQQAVEEAEEDLDKWQRQFNEITNKQRAIRVDAQVKLLSRSFENIDAALPGLEEQRQQNQAELTKAELPPDKGKVDRAMAVLTERGRRCIAENEAFKASAKEMAESLEATKVVQYWHTAFSPTGIPNMVLQDVMEPLNLTSRRLSAVLTSGSLEIIYATHRTLDSGVDRAELDIQVKNKAGAGSISGSSKGEARMVNMVIVETLAEIGQVARRVNFRWFDDMLVAQHELNRRIILSYLRELAREQGILIFVADHSAEAGNYADHTLLVEKTAEGMTTARWR
jgi:DNA repair exonuclease SbcCD ATPase subunit